MTDKPKYPTFKDYRHKEKLVVHGKLSLMLEVMIDYEQKPTSGTVSVLWGDSPLACERVKPLFIGPRAEAEAHFNQMVDSTMDKIFAKLPAVLSFLASEQIKRANEMLAASREMKGERGEYDPTAHCKECGAENHIDPDTNPHRCHACGLEFYHGSGEGE